MTADRPVTRRLQPRAAGRIIGQTGPQTPRDPAEKHPHTPVAGLVVQLDEVPQGAQVRVDGVEVGDVVAIVPIEAQVDGVEPQAGHAEPGQVVEAVDEPRQVADPVTVGVLIRVDVEAVDDRLVEPALGHSRQYPVTSSPTRCPRASNPTAPSLRSWRPCRCRRGRAHVRHHVDRSRSAATRTRTVMAGGRGKPGATSGIPTAERVDGPGRATRRQRTRQ